MSDDINMQALEIFDIISRDDDNEDNENDEDNRDNENEENPNEIALKREGERKREYIMNQIINP
ncbi:hypothetical protein RhiirA4_487961 [Rhizophagus irregularis]|uniref:Uncharacterized protein n=1 Tax=Rhizophagus irregularis TaxID=588596 RepID=A0A2I1HT66_9GLOM|nr:hypothetical protein RhiirA4_487961 [Rhizophagus irregularis]